jgi:hypothetical protein
MDRAAKPFVHLPIDAVDTVVYDPEGAYDPERYDHYSTFVEARDAALSSVELLLDEGDYDGDDHREELERMLAVLETVETFDELNAKPDYHWFIRRIAAPARPHAA